MSIEDSDGNDIVRLSGIWSLLLKIAIVLAPPVFLTLIGWGTWITVQHFDLRSRVALLEYVRDHGRASPEVSQNVNVGSAANDARAAALLDDAAARRGYYLASEVAKLLGKSERTITELCAKGAIPGATREAQGDSSPWRIPLDFQISGKLPQTAAVSSKQPQSNDETTP